MLLEPQDVNNSEKGLKETINNWLNARQALWVTFCRAGQLPPFSTKYPLAKDVHVLCNTLIDYVSQGHFQVYDKLFNVGRLLSVPGYAKAEQILEALIDNTQKIADFSDKYAENVSIDMKSESLKADISSLGEALSEREKLENQLVEILYFSPIKLMRLSKAS